MVFIVCNVLYCSVVVVLYLSCSPCSAKFVPAPACSFVVLICSFTVVIFCHVLSSPWYVLSCVVFDVLSFSVLVILLFVLSCHLLSYRLYPSPLLSIMFFY